MDEFILIFRHQDGKKVASPEQIQIWMKQTMDWINEQANKPGVNALFALMCFHTSRFPARKNDHGEIILYQDQDESPRDIDNKKSKEYFQKAFTLARTQPDKNGIQKKIEQLDIDDQH